MATLDKKARRHAVDLAMLAAALVARRNDHLNYLINSLKTNGVTRRAVSELILQSYLHDGYATALEGMSILADLWPEPSELLEPEGYRDFAKWQERGRELFGEIYGDVADRAESNIKSVSPELALWMLTEGYGKVLSRGILDPATRELGTVAVLVLKRRPTQLYSHLRGSLRTGVTLIELNTLFNRIQQEIPDPAAAAEARGLLSRVARP